MKQLCKNIKSLRLQYEYSQEELAKLIGYDSKFSIDQIENGIVDISELTIKRFADVFNTTSIELICCENILDKKEFSNVEEYESYLNLIYQQELNKINLLNNDGKAMLLRYLRFLLQNSDNLK